MSDENVEDIIASIDVPDPVEDALEAYRVECVRSSSTYRQRGKAADALRDAVRRSIYEAEKRGEEDARASRPREAKCPACGGVGEHVEGKRGFTRFPCPNAAPPVAPEACPVAWQVVSTHDGYSWGVFDRSNGGEQKAAQFARRGPHRVVPLCAQPASASAEGGSLVDAVERVLLTAEPVTERQGDEDVVVGYRHKTGAIHALLTAVRERGSSVSMPRPATPASAAGREGAVKPCGWCGGQGYVEGSVNLRPYRIECVRCHPTPTGPVIPMEGPVRVVALPATPAASAAGREGAVEKARQAFYEAARALAAVIDDHCCEPESRSAAKASATCGEREFAFKEAYTALLAAEAEGGGA